MSECSQCYHLNQGLSETLIHKWDCFCLCFCWAVASRILNLFLLTLKLAHMNSEIELKCGAQAVVAHPLALILAFPEEKYSASFFFNSFFFFFFSTVSPFTSTKSQLVSWYVLPWPKSTCLAGWQHSSSGCSWWSTLEEIVYDVMQSIKS